MPELPEVESICRGLKPRLVGRCVKTAVVRCAKLRWPVPSDISKKISNQEILDIKRRGKYLLFIFDSSALMIHLGMSGFLHLVTNGNASTKHDHVDFVLDNGFLLRFNDPRRFGSVLLTEKDPLQHKLLKDLGPEPLGDDFDGKHLFNSAKNRSLAIKNFIMDSKVVVGVGNIYASEALFLAKIKPDASVCDINLQQYVLLADSIKSVLLRAIDAGGTTFRDFRNHLGEKGGFAESLYVYNRSGLPCRICGTTIEKITIGQRSTYFCPNCQKYG
ncbi:MAG: bifunctional DNA-formamidopyrimidine glycosylase/DNA-(apurinic or apyrimidinic site) lyase [Gammaproteobacteria bacterium]|nr:bifunctional DNA-formamidopyrimidine glycosylase/DNA-(apurinic or apyrimidinic site) lyase [Gammaproteobacteria bacterium]